MAHLARVGEVSDHTGKASTMLAATVGYPGSSVAFAQLLTGMERAGLIQREIRGKRTYRIIPGPAAPPPGSLTQPAAAPGDGTHAAPAPGGGTRPAPEQARPAAAAPQPVPGPAGAPAGAAHRADAATAEAPETGAAAETGPAVAGLDLPAGPGGVDYDELARRLLVQVVRRLAGPDAGRAGAEPAAGAAPGRPVVDEPVVEEPVVEEPVVEETVSQETALQETVASLEQKLASATSRQRRLAEENTRLREQLRAAEQSLAEAQDRATAEALAGRFDSAEVLLLERLLSPLREQRRQSPEADAG
jgi:hypothetical protein